MHTSLPEFNGYAQQRLGMLGKHQRSRVLAALDKLREFERKNQTRNASESGIKIAEKTAFYFCAFGVKLSYVDCKATIRIIDFSFEPSDPWGGRPKSNTIRLSNETAFIITNAVSTYFIKNPVDLDPRAVETVMSSDVSATNARSKIELYELKYLLSAHGYFASGLQSECREVRAVYVLGIINLFKSSSFARANLLAESNATSGALGSLPNDGTCAGNALSKYAIAPIAHSTPLDHLPSSIHFSAASISLLKLDNFCFEGRAISYENLYARKKKEFFKEISAVGYELLLFRDEPSANEIAPTLNLCTDVTLRDVGKLPERTFSNFGNQSDYETVTGTHESHLLPIAHSTSLNDVLLSNFLLVSLIEPLYLLEIGGIHFNSLKELAVAKKNFSVKKLYADSYARPSRCEKYIVVYPTLYSPSGHPASAASTSSGFARSHVTNLEPRNYHHADFWERLGLTPPTAAGSTANPDDEKRTVGVNSKDLLHTDVPTTTLASITANNYCDWIPELGGSLPSATASEMATHKTLDCSCLA